MAQSSYASDFGSGRDLTVHGFEPDAGLGADSLRAWSLLPILGLPFSLCPSLLILSVCLSLSQKVNIKKSFKKSFQTSALFTTVFTE